MTKSSRAATMPGGRGALFVLAHLIELSCSGVRRLDRSRKRRADIFWPCSRQTCQRRPVSTAALGRSRTASTVTLTRKLLGSETSSPTRGVFATPTVSATPKRTLRSAKYLRDEPTTRRAEPARSSSRIASFVRFVVTLNAASCRGEDRIAAARELPENARAVRASASPGRLNGSTERSPPATAPQLNPRLPRFVARGPAPTLTVSGRTLTFSR